MCLPDICVAVEVVKTLEKLYANLEFMISYASAYEKVKVRTG